MVDKITGGLALVGNDFGNTVEGNSILRYVEPSSQIQDIDFVPAVGFKLNSMIAVGAGLNYSQAHFLLEPRFGFAGLTLSDSQSRNDTRGSGLGGDAGLVLKPTDTTTIGFNYRSSVTYRLNGSSAIDGGLGAASSN